MASNTLPQSATQAAPDSPPNAARIQIAIDCACHMDAIIAALIDSLHREQREDYLSEARLPRLQQLTEIISGALGDEHQEEKDLLRSLFGMDGARELRAGVPA